MAEPFSGPTIVVTHHAPTPRAIHERYAGNPLNTSYASDFEAMFPTGIDLWVHGHTHVSLGLNFGTMRVVCNRRDE